MTLPLKTTALLATLAAAGPLAAQEGANGTSFVEEFDRLDTARWYVSDGWNNGAHQNCTWSKDAVKAAGGKLTLSFDARPAGERRYACGEVQTRKRYG